MRTELPHSSNLLNVWKQALEGLRKITAEPDSRATRLFFLSLKILLVLYFVFCAVLLSVRYFVLPQIGQYKSDVEKILSKGLKHEVTISKIDASWYGFHPLLKLDELAIRNSSGTSLLRLPEVKIVVSWKSFFVFDLRLSRLEINHPELDIYRDDQGKIFIAGIQIKTDGDEESGMDWILKQDVITIHNGNIKWRDDFKGTDELSLKNIHFMLKNAGRHHRMRLLADPLVRKTSEMDIRADFVHPFFAKRIADFSKWNGTLYVSLPSVELDAWKPYFDFPDKLINGSGAVNAWLTLHDGRIDDLTVDAALNNFMLRIKPDLPVLNFRHISGRLSFNELLHDDLKNEVFSIGDMPYSIKLENIAFETADNIKAEGFDASGKYTPAINSNPENTELKVNNFDLSTFIQFAKYFPLQEDYRKILKEASPLGVLNSFVIQWEGSPSDLHVYRLNGKFEEASVKSVKWKTMEIPGFQNLTGQVFIDQKGGSVELDSKKAQFHLPLYFPKSNWQFDELKLMANWSFSGQDQFALDVKKLHFLLDGMSGEAFGKYTRSNSDTKNHIGKIDATAEIKSVDIAKVKEYVPLKTNQDLRVWLTKAFEGGVANNVSARLKGELSQFPFVDKTTAPDSEFSVSLDIHDGRLNYAPTILTKSGKLAWMPIDKINGTMKINGAQIAIHADTAELNKVVLSQVDALIPDMFSDDVLLQVSGKAKGDLQNFVQFTNASPINDVIGGLTEDAKTKGSSDLTLKLHLPLSDMENAKVQGTLQFANNEVTLFPDLPVLTAVQGKVHFSDQGFHLENMNALFLGGKVNITGATKNGGSQVKAIGQLTAEGLQKNYAGGALGKLMKRLSGSLSYVLSITQPADSKSGYPNIVLESDTKGFGINLPAPLGKSRSEYRKLSVMANSAGKQHDEIKITYGSVGSAHYERQKVNKTWRLTRGGIGVNMEPVLKPGVMLNLKMPALDVNVWAKLLNELLDDGGKGFSSNKGAGSVEGYVNPQQFYIQVDKLDAMKYVLTNAQITGMQNERGCQANIDSNELKGILGWVNPTGNQKTGKLIGRFASLAIPRSKPDEIDDIIQRDSVRKIPAIDIKIDDLTLFDIKLGHVELLANNITDGKQTEWRVNRLAIANSDAKLNSTGRWRIDKTGISQTSMAYNLDVHNAGNLLDRFGYKKILKGGDGKITGDLSWNGLPYSLDIPSLSGKMKMDIGKGQFLKVEPGIAKLLGVFSLQTLPRRLTLDFKDIFSEGFAFDEIIAHANIEKGIASTENMTMKGVQATVLMNGSVNLAKETQNLHIAVLPQINAGIASIAYGLINPAIGVGTFLAQLFLKDPLSKTFTYEYQITGSWENPEIKKIENKKSGNKNDQDLTKPTSKE